jgi:hypothetical protein
MGSAHALLRAVLPALVLAAPSAWPLTINLIDIGTTPMTAAQFAAFQAAAKIWEDRFVDSVTVTVNVAWDAAGTFSSPSVLAATTTARTTHTVANVTTAMLLDTSAGDELAAIGLVPATLPIDDVNGFRNAGSLTLATANAKALGLSFGLDPTYGAALPNSADATIRYNLAYLADFDIDRSDGIDPARYDFIGVAAHELGHALGFLSLTDVQDNNPTFTLFPSTLDLWRFVESGGFHAIDTETRPLTAGPAEYYDSDLNNRGFSRGTLVTDTLCNTASTRCQASHWRDNLGNLMDPTVARGVRQDPRSDDAHAFDFIGYNPRLIAIIPWWRFRYVEVFWFEPPCLVCPPEYWEKVLRPLGFEPPPRLDTVEPPFDANLGGYLAIDLGIKGFEKRSAVGFARFAAPLKNPDPTVLESTNPEDQKPWEELGLPTEPMEVIPARLMDLYLESEETGGPRFRFRANVPRGGVQFDPTLGRYGGFRVSGFLDGTADNETRGDDAALVMVLLLTQDVDPGQGLEGLVCAADPDARDNGGRIADYVAFGIDPKDSDEDGVPDQVDNCLLAPNPSQTNVDRNGLTDVFGNACDPDFNGDGVVSAADYLILRAALNTADPVTDLNDDGRVTAADYLILRGRLNQPPGPSGLEP